MNASISVLAAPSSIHLDGMAREEQCVVVVVELGPLVRLEGVLDGQLVEAQLVGHLM